MRCPSFAVPSVRSVRICVSPRMKSAEPCVRGLMPTSHAIGRISSVPRPSDAASTAIFRRIELIVDGLGGLLDVVAGEIVLHGEGLTLDRQGRPRRRSTDSMMLS